MGLDDYSYMLSDAVRIDLFRRAIEQTVKPGDVVAEIGAGLGTYSFFACQAGAARAYAIEDSMGDALEAISARQEFADRIKVLKENSLEVSLPERADVIIFEDFSNTFIDAELARVVRDATSRFLAPGGRWLPAEGSLWGALVESPELHEEFARWRQGAPHVEGLNFQILSQWLLNEMHMVKVKPGSLITPPRRLRTYRLGDPEERFVLDCRVEDTPLRAGSAHGLAVWFRIVLAENIVLDNSPGGDDTAYMHAFFPVTTPLPVRKGEGVPWSLRSIRDAEGEELWWKWAAESGGVIEEGTTFESFPLSKSDLMRNTPGHVPKLGRRRQIDRFILNAVDGRRSHEAIAAMVRAEYPGEFSSETEAFRHVAETLGSWDADDGG